MIDEKTILSKLSVIIDPDLHKSITDLGFVKNIKINQNSVSLDIELTTPACPLKANFKKQAEDLLHEIEGVEDVHVNMTAPPPKEKEKGLGYKNVHSIIAVASCKGGVGKSTSAATIACELKAKGYKVGLLDLDLFGPSVPTLFDIPNKEVFAIGDMLVPVNYNGLKLMSFGWLIGNEPAVMRGPMVSGYVSHLLNAVSWGELDYLIIDMPPGTGDIQLTLAQSIELDGAVIVTTPASLAIVDVIKGIIMFEKVGIPVLGVINNMAYFECDKCHEKHYLFGDGTKALTERFGIDTVIDIPLEKQRGTSFANYESNATNSHLVDEIVCAIGKSKIEEKRIPDFETTPEGLKVSLGKETRIIDYKTLRFNCRCALCIEEYSNERILHLKDIPDDIHPLEISTVGTYALNVKWSDGHTSSIYPYSLLLGPKLTCEE